VFGGNGQFTLDRSLAGHRSALLVFWSAVCSHCRRYDEYFNTFHQRHPQIAFIAIASRRNEKNEAIQSAVRERGLTFPILLDDDGQLARQYFAQQTPRCYLIDSNRKLLYRGAIDNFKMPRDPEYIPYLEPAIASFLAGEPIARAETASFGCAIETVYYHLPGQL
jgi:thiol-disulfide isomerase/thioredoxin